MSAPSEAATSDLSLTGLSASLNILDNHGSEVMGIANKFAGISNGNDLNRDFVHAPNIM